MTTKVIIEIVWRPLEDVEATLDLQSADKIGRVFTFALIGATSAQVYLKLKMPSSAFDIRFEGIIFKVVKLDIIESWSSDRIFCTAIVL